MIIKGRKLTDIRLGHSTEPITIAISSLTLSNCESLQRLNLSRISSLTGVVDVSSCYNLREVSFDGTNLTQVKLPNGGGLRKINYNANNQYLTLRNYPLLSETNININECKHNITDLYI